MIAAVEVASTTSTDVARTTQPAIGVPATSAVLVGHDVDRERELDLMAANIEGAAEGLAVFLLLALFGVAFVVAMLTGVLG